MKQINVLHLYYNLMNLSGENGNMVAIEDALKEQKVKYSIDRLSIGDKIDFNKYHLIYIGNGSRDSQEMARQDLLKYKYKLEKVFKNKLIIATGNSFELFGKSIDNKECLGFLPFKSMYLKEYVVEEKIVKTDFIDHDVISFINRNSEANIKDNFFLENEGIHIGNFYGTYTLGPLLIRNPYLLNKFIEMVVTDAGFKYVENINTPDMQAYNEYIKRKN
jgi:CobQ-like glutamine amidotransferase family enzyme